MPARGDRVWHDTYRAGTIRSGDADGRTVLVRFDSRREVWLYPADLQFDA